MRRIEGLAGKVAVIAAFALLACAAPAYATFPGENGKIAYTQSEPNGTSEIFSIDPDGSDLTPLTGPSSVDSSPAWSPDGSRIAFTRAYFSPGVASWFNVLVMNGDGTGVTNFTGSRTNASESYPAWSPDGGKIAFVGGDICYQGFPPPPCDDEADLMSANLDGTGLTQITNQNGLAEYDSEWSPDGTRIAFATPGAIYTIRPDGGDVGLVAPTNGVDSLSWSPDSLRIAFAEGGGPGPGDFDIFVVNADGTGLTNLTSSPDFESSPAWSPDGSKIVYGKVVAPDESGLCTETTPCARNLEIMNADGSGRHRITHDVYGFRSALPDWQPLPANEPPDCSGVAADPSSLRPPNHRFRRVTLAGATDPDGDAVTLTIDGVTQDEPVGRRPDARAGGSADEVKLRAQRDPRGDGRVYRIAFTASDAQGGECSGEATVEVRRKRHQPAVDSAPPSYDSL